MPRSFLDAIQRWAKKGMYWPFVHDPQRNEPSVTLMFFYMAFMLAFVAIMISSIMQLVKGDYINATLMPMMLLVLGFVFYRLRNLDRVKIDFDDREIELSDDSQPKKDKLDVSEN